MSPLVSLHLAEHRLDTDGGESGESEVESCERKLTDQGRCQPKVVGSVCWYQPSARCQRCQLANQGHCRLKVIPGHWNQPGAPSEQSPAAYLEKIRRFLVTGIGQVGLATDAAFQAKYCDRKVQANKNVPTAR